MSKKKKSFTHNSFVPDPTKFIYMLLILKKKIKKGFLKAD